MTLKLYGYFIASGEQKSPEVRKYQPFGLTPYIDDDGFILYENRAIFHYIASKYLNQGTPLISSELKANALYHQAASIELTSFEEYAAKFSKEKFLVPRQGGITDEALCDRLLVKLSATLDVYDLILSKQKSLAGDEITLADLYHLPYCSSLQRAGTDVLEIRPNVKRWWSDISSRPSWIAVKDGVKSTI